MPDSTMRDVERSVMLKELRASAIVVYGARRVGEDS